ncbi:hypothetical protein CI109_106365 [Kwoniella shandongensis]|uniref:Uncharacterized protein n=1 Tax=Kwoniella shandongensis TaxID=1734106 RepID=A0A5M6BSJ4_9TREE|nr:uncharacterized protein CI109_005930 [Kwoniella shandongensis]KAA5525767.1 hypothetical protein CI109_005930 [Kwoniella shandongensis]
MSTRSMPSAQPLPLKNLLATYTTSHPLRSPSPLPPSSRVDPKIRQRLPPPTSASPLLWTLPTWWLFLRFLATKGWQIVWALVCHFLVGPKRPSWGYRMTFIVSCMRKIADHSTLADIVLIRRFISLHFLLPIPADAVVTPITFTVPLRKGDEVARGFLREWDLKETGTRELTGEWVVGTEVWRRLKAERRARQRTRRRASPANNVPVANGLLNEKRARGRRGESPATVDVDTNSDSEPGKKTGLVGERVIYYVHGGAYYVGNAATHRLITIGVSKACNARVFAITYRLAPEHTFPLPLHDVLQGYLRLLSAPLSIPPENIIIAGDSAGGGLSLALCMYLRDEGYKLPAGLVLMSPWVDLTMSCGSWDENADSDVVPRPEADDHLNPVGCYLGPEGISTYITHPYASPLFGDFHGLPPMLIQSGDSEVLRDEITLLAHKATLAGVHVSHELYEDMVHVFQQFPFLAESAVAINSVGRWVRTTLPKIEEAASELEGSEKKAGRLAREVDENVDQEMTSEKTRVVNEIGQETGLPNGEVQLLPDEIDAVRDQSARLATSSTKPKTPKRSPLQFETGEEESEQPTVDVDSLPADDSDSSTPTWGGAPSSSSTQVRSPGYRFGSGILLPSPQVDSQQQQQQPHTLPRLRRSQTSTIVPTSPTPIRRRRPTTISLQVSPAIPPTSPPHSQSASSNPVSPTPSARRRLRNGTITSHPQPSTRARSRSHSDIFNLVEGYVEGGAANETVVYAPGGEVKSVGVLGGEEDEDDEDGGGEF